jgi:hypothetical protein
VERFAGGFAAGGSGATRGTSGATVCGWGGRRKELVASVNHGISLR